MALLFEVNGVLIGKVTQSQIANPAASVWKRSLFTYLLLWTVLELFQFRHVVWETSNGANEIVFFNCPVSRHKIYYLHKINRTI